MPLTINEKIKNMDLIDAAIKNVRTNLWDGIKIQCYNKEEADWCKHYCETFYPDVSVCVTWLDFKLEK